MNPDVQIDAPVHDHRCSDACMASEEHMRAMEKDADRQLAEMDAYDDDSDLRD